MKKIDNKEHRDLIDIFERYKYFYEKYGNVIIPEQEDEVLRQNITKLIGSYEYYNVLLSELKVCIHNYQTIKDSVKVKMYSPVRKMTNINKKKK